MARLGGDEFAVISTIGDDDAKMMAVAQRRVLMLDHQKFDRVALHALSDLKAFDLVLLTSKLARERVEELQEAGVPIQLVDVG